MAANVSTDTTVNQLLEISGMTLEDFRLHNINLFFGNSNSIEYASSMFKFNTLYEIEEKISS